MYLGCRYIGSEADVVWQVDSVHIGFHGNLDIEVEGDVVLAFALDAEEGFRRRPSSPCSEGPSAGSSARSSRTSSPT